MMAYNHKRLCVMAYADRFTLWKYSTPHTGAEVLAPGYFKGASPMPGDWIMVTTDCDTWHQAGILIVGENVDGDLTVANIGGIK